MVFAKKYTTFFCCLLSIVHTSSGKKGILRNGTMDVWFERAFVLSGVGQIWEPKGTKVTAHKSDDPGFSTLMITKTADIQNSSQLMYVDIEAKVTSCSSDSICYFQVFIYREDREPTFPPEIEEIRKYFSENFRPVYNITVSKLDRKEIKTFKFRRNGSDLTFGIVASRVFGELYSMNLYYYYCEETFYKSLELPDTTSPDHGFKEVMVSCSENSSPASNETTFRAQCLHNGTWRTDAETKCLCDKGFEANPLKGCIRCQEDTYKDHIGNGKCLSCPSHSKSSNAIKCECEEGYHRFVGKNYTHACHGIPSAARNIEFDKSDRSVNLTWLRPSREGGDKVFYDIDCFECKGDECKDSCQKETYSPSKSNLTQPNVIVGDLEPNTKYEFVIYSKNANSYRISKEKWESARRTIETDQGRILPPVPTVSRPSFDISPIVSAIVTFFVLLIIGTSCLFGLWIRKRRKNRPANNTLSQLELEDLRPSERDQTPDYEIIDHPNETNEPSEYEEIDVATILPLDNYYEFWEIPMERIVMLNTLGHGSFGTVKKAWIKSIHGKTPVSGNVVAVKLLKENATLRDEEDFLNELDVMKKLVRHRFVVQLLGCCTQSEPYHLILEYLPGGDLLGYLRKSRGYKDSYNTGELVPTSRLNETELMRFAWMVSDAMVSLSSQGVVHRDLAARNVLVGEGNICKVSDFGLAREGRYERKTKARLPVKWMAPEDLLHGLCTSRSDVWAYGILLWEIFTVGDSPYPAIKGPDVIGLIEAGYRMPKPAHCSDSLYAIMLKCWNDNPDERPAFTEIRSFFKEHLHNNQVCLDLSKYDDDEYLNFDVVD